MRASGHNGDIRRALHGYERTREAAMSSAHGRRNTAATMSLTCSSSSPPEPLGKFITT
jgi:hypothetical protein